MDTSPIIFLTKTGYLNLLATSAEEILVPEAVAEEALQASPDDPARKGLEAAGERFAEPAGSVTPLIKN
ncbi:putative nucleic acid-binding protein [Salinibacter ruber]|uniref:hypothetical protein n=1 Tax=Salinibacter ruber TaxID=146919 RepID=UPI0021671A02|nr:hypothetical protein [Salinibacter ruber]MCS3856612.1 putative nucleic acid-binding protein [Salinibacter ruber]